MKLARAIAPAVVQCPVRAQNPNYEGPIVSTVSKTSNVEAAPSPVFALQIHAGRCYGYRLYVGFRN